MTNPSKYSNVLNELLISGLRPVMVVTYDPFSYAKTNPVKLLVKKVYVHFKYLLNKRTFKEKFQPYFLAKKYDIPVFSSQKVNSIKFENILKQLNIDYAFTFGFKILKENIIKAPRLGCINFHPAYLPYNRGATPSKWIIVNDQNFTGITFHYISKGIDEGEIIERYKIPLSGYENSEILNNYLYSLGGILLVQLIYKIKSGAELVTKKNELNKGSYEKPFIKEHRKITGGETSQHIKNRIHAARDGYKYAIYNFNGFDREIVNYVELISLDVKSYPCEDTDGNLLIKTKDNKYLKLISHNK